MIKERRPQHRLRGFSLIATALAGCVLTGTAVRAAEPITIGFGMALTGGLAAAGKTALLAMQIWQDDVNAKEGLLGRQVIEQRGPTRPGEDVVDRAFPPVRLVLELSLIHISEPTRRS